jgi:hypothetical protein
MSNQLENKDFAPAVISARKALEPHIKQWQQFAGAINKALNTFLEEHRETLELWGQFAKIYPQLEPYLDNISKGLNDPDFEMSNDVVELAHIFEAIDLQKDPNTHSLLYVISNQAFQKSLIGLYSGLTLD